MAHNNQRTVSERFYRDHGDSASKYPIIQVSKCLGLSDQQAKINLEKPRFLQFCDFLKTDINIPTENFEQKNKVEELIFC